MTQSYNGDEAVKSAHFQKLWNFIKEEFTENDADLLDGLIALRTACAILEKVMDIEPFTVEVQDEAVAG